MVINEWMDLFSGIAVIPGALAEPNDIKMAIVVMYGGVIGAVFTMLKHISGDVCAFFFH